MLKTFRIITSLKNKYRVNGIIYYLKKVPIIKKYIKSDWYKNTLLKILTQLVSILMEIFRIFVYKGLYIYAMIFLPSMFLPDLIFKEIANEHAFITIFFFLSLVGMLLNSDIVGADNDKRYAVFLLRMDAYKYTMVTYYYFMLRTFVGFFTVLFFNRKLFDLSILHVFCLSFIVVSLKTIYNYILILDYKTGFGNKHKSFKANLIALSFILFFGAAYLLPFINIMITNEILIFLTLLLLGLGIAAFIKIYTFDDYYKLFRKSARDMQALVDTNSAQLAIKQIEVDDKITSNKDGFDYLNDLFVKRHRRIIYKPIRNISVVALIVVLFVNVLGYFDQESARAMNGFLHHNLPYLLLFMYYANRTQTFAQAMFNNCDHSLLSYPFYREPSNMLKLFRVRIKSSIMINLIPTVIIAVGLVVLLKITGGGEIYLYPLLFLVVICMNIFFSVHHLVLYYLLQPYDVDITAKSPLYGFVNAVTYIICYMVYGLAFDSVIFSIVIVAFTVIYTLVSFILIYKFAHKTFKLRL